MTALGERVGRVLGPDLRRLIVLIAVCFVDMIGLLMIAPLLTFYALRLGGQASTVGPLFSAFAVAQLLASPISAGVPDLGPRVRSLWTAPGVAHRAAGIGDRLLDLRIRERSLAALRVSIRARVWWWNDWGGTSLCG